MKDSLSEGEPVVQHPLLLEQLRQVSPVLHPVAADVLRSYLLVGKAAADKFLNKSLKLTLHY